MVSAIPVRRVFRPAHDIVNALAQKGNHAEFKVVVPASAVPEKKLKNLPVVHYPVVSTVDSDDADDTLPSALKPPPPPCFGYGSSQKGSWSKAGEWKPSTKNVCDLNEYWDFFEHIPTTRAVGRCFHRRRWVVFAGDSNSRKLYWAIRMRFRDVGYKSAFVGGTSSGGKRLFGDNRWSDRDAIFWNEKRTQVFRISLRFFRSLESFENHWNNWDMLYEGNGEVNIHLNRQWLNAKKIFMKSYHTSLPDTLIFSSGLWNISCGTAAKSYLHLQEEYLRINNVLYMTPGHLLHHKWITNADVKKALDCVLAERDKLLFNVTSVAKIPPIFDVYELTENLPNKNWVGYGGGYHYCDDHGRPSTVGKAVVAGWLSFVCN